MERKVLIVLLMAIGLALNGAYKQPPREILDVFNAPPMQHLMSVRGTEKVIEYAYQRYASLEQVSEPYLELAGKKINPRLNSQVKNYPYTSLKMRNVETEERVDITDAGDKYIYDFTISQNRKYIAYLTEQADGIIIKVKNLDNGTLVYKTDFKINYTIDYMAMDWSVDGEHLIFASIPQGRGPKPLKSVATITPSVEESFGKTAKVRTYQNLLKDKYDEALFDYYYTSQLIRVNMGDGSAVKIGEPGIFQGITESPDEKYYMVKKLSKPYSYSVPYYRFGYAYELWSATGKTVKTLVSKPIQDQIPIYGVEKGLRYPSWIPTENSTIYWVVAQDEGDPKVKVPHRDYIYKLASPFEGEGNMFRKAKERFGGFSWFKQSGRYICSEYDNQKEWRQKFIADYKDDSFQEMKILDMSSNDKYNNPGTLLTEKLDNGYDVIRQDGEFVYMKGAGDTPKGKFPFLDKVNVKNWQKERIFQSGEKEYETFYTFYKNDYNRPIISSQSTVAPRNYFILNLKTGEKKKISDNIDHTPWVRNIKKELVTYQREDSLLLSGTLYLPPDYDKNKKYPLFIWAYPREFADAKTASQVSGTQNTFTSFWGCSPIYLALHGYVVLNNAAMPVIGDVEKRNDTFDKQIVMNAKAAIDYLDGRGFIDPARVAVGGHSYGAFMTANLLAHCDLFKAGIARSGAYNRTLTPFGFQSERRTLWEAKEFYTRVSPFMNAEKIKTPLLLIHGANDSNPGTYPIQSERLFAGLKGNGGIARLCMLPYEDHSYHAKESNLHVLAEMCEWLDKFLK